MKSNKTRVEKTAVSLNVRLETNRLLIAKSDELEQSKSEVADRILHDRLKLEQIDMIESLAKRRAEAPYVLANGAKGLSSQLAERRAKAESDREAAMATVKLASEVARAKAESDREAALIALEAEYQLECEAIELARAEGLAELKQVELKTYADCEATWLASRQYRLYKAILDSGLDLEQPLDKAIMAKNIKCPDLQLVYDRVRQAINDWALSERILLIGDNRAVSGLGETWVFVWDTFAMHRFHRKPISALDYLMKCPVVEVSDLQIEVYELVKGSGSWRELYEKAPDEADFSIGFYAKKDPCYSGWVKDEDLKDTGICTKALLEVDKQTRSSLTQLLESKGGCWPAGNNWQNWATTYS